MMSIPASCSDDRVALARRGVLSPTEWYAFATHLSECPDCRIAWRLAGDFDRSAPARPGDERIIARAAKRASGLSARPRVNLVRVAVAAAVTIVAAGVASGAILLRARYADLAIRAEENARPRSSKVRVARPGHATTPAAMPTAFVSQSTAERQAGAATVAGSGPQRLVRAPEAGKSTTSSAKHMASLAAPDDRLSPALAPRPHQEDAATLFAFAVAERQQGRQQTAIAGFRSLQRQFPNSREATVSLVSLGDLLLGAGGPADALHAFEAYLLRAPDGPLAPEALIGKARALDALGRTADAVSAWREIARRFPDSPYARRALGADPRGTSP